MLFNRCLFSLLAKKNLLNNLVRYINNKISVQSSTENIHTFLGKYYQYIHVVHNNKFQKSNKSSFIRVDNHYTSFHQKIKIFNEEYFKKNLNEIKELGRKHGILK